MTRPARLGGASLIGCVLVWAASAVAGPLVDDGRGTALVTVGVVLFVAGLFGVRHRVTGRTVGAPFIVACAIGVAAEVVGTTARVSGVLLSVPVAAVMLAVLWRSVWRIGDLAAITTVLGIGLGAAYLLDAALHPDTGSSADQGAIVLIALGLALSLVAMLTAHPLPFAARSAIGGGALGMAVPAAAAVGVGLAWVGLDSLAKNE